MLTLWRNKLLEAEIILLVQIMTQEFSYNTVQLVRTYFKLIDVRFDIPTCVLILLLLSCDG